MDSSSLREDDIIAPGDLSRALRQCLGHFATGVAVVSYETAAAEARGLTVNSFTSVSLDPPLVLICLNKRSRAIDRLPRVPFAVNVLGADQRDLAWHFAGKPANALPIWQCLGKVPLLAQSLAWMTCDPWSNHDAGDHIILVGRVREFGVNQQDPLCFYRGEFIGIAPSAPLERTTAKETTS
jgi:flavin reductase (DIM6/NTAB) family NADH-FMN oxidoreductase RutF